MKREILLLVSLIILLTIQFEKSYEEELVDLPIEVKYTNGDRVDFYEMKFVVFQDFSKTPFIIKTAEGNPDIIPKLPVNHNYKIEVYVNNMFGDVGYIDLKNKSQKIDINIPLSGGLQLNVFYKDGQTPINDATVVIKSQDGTEWRKGITNELGETLRFWLQSTVTQSDNYTVDVYLGEIKIATYSPVKLQPGLARDQKIVTIIPETIQDLITITLYKTPDEKLTKNDGIHKVILKDIKGKIVDAQQVNIRSQTFFSNLKSGQYTIEVERDGRMDELWPSTEITVIGTQNQFNIFKNQPIEIISNDEDSNSVEHATCNCVAFRFDDVQDYWLNDVQIQVINQFLETNIPLTVGVIADSIGNDQKLTEFVKSALKSGHVELASHGIGTAPFTEYTKQEQKSMLNESLSLINANFGIKPKIFIPPQNRFNQDTIDVIKESSITHLSASILHGDTPPFPLTNQKLYRFPQVSTTGVYDPQENVFKGIESQTTVEETIRGIDNYGFAVITMHPQEFSIIEDGVYTNNINEKQITELQKTIYEIQKQGIKIVFLSKINLDSDVIIPEWIKSNAGWWADGSIDDNTFVTGIQYLVKEKIIIVTHVEPETEISTEIPPWIKNNAGWWANGQITNIDFIKGIEYLISKGIIKY